MRCVPQEFRDLQCGYIKLRLCDELGVDYLELVQGYNYVSNTVSDKV